MIIALALLGGCGVPIFGSGEVVTETSEVDDFERLQVDSAFDVRVRQGEIAEVTLRVDENALDRVIMQVEGDTLRLGLERAAVLRDVTLEADVVVPDLRAILASGASTVTLAEPFESSELEADLSGASQLDGEVALDSLTTRASGASQLTLGGSAQTGTLEASGASELALAGLTFSELDARLSGASSADVDVSDQLAVELAGASELSYSGQPEITDQSVTGASSLDSSG